ncbi:hypothetical protein [uncultured Sphaerochaeta sp.]|jgi:hypothetical protein|uniref:hypothetical protein n=1 Tax=uncultured Sphaerochaeta sp. TaxID=886478 RepID=UPI0026036E95|nr:hypothetical protein [uncultured Sphaerochaeta sp.]
MTRNDEINTFITNFNAYTVTVLASKEKAQKFLQDSGIYTKKGNLKKEYRTPCTAQKTT